MYQKTYGPKIGTVKLNIKKATAGARVNCRLTYKAGFYGVDDSGSIKVLFRIVSDYEEFQFDDPQKPNYVRISSSNKKVSFKVAAPSGGIFGKVYTRPWSRGFTIHVAEAYLDRDDEVYIDFVNWNTQTFYEETFEFRVMVNPFATAKYLQVPHAPEIELTADTPAKLVVLAPTAVKKGEKFRVFVRVEDRWGNPCRQTQGMFYLSADGDISVPKQVVCRAGRAVFWARAKEMGTVAIHASFAKLRARSNPVTVLTRLPLRPYWADLHAQSEETVGTGSVYDYFRFAREYGFVDIASHQANDFQISKETWWKINDAADTYSKEGEFVAFPGYEYSPNTLNGGDHNVIYRRQSMPIHRSSHALLDDYSDIATDAPTIKDLLRKFQKFPAKDVLVIAHVGGRYADIKQDAGDDSLRRFVEVHSCWGTFEWMLQDAFSQGKRVGVVANSDGHTGRPGAEHPGVLHFTTYGGYTCVLAKSLIKKDVFDALLARHTYCTTGDRIYLDVSAYVDNKKFIMGDVIKKSSGKQPVLHVATRGSSPVDRIEVWNKDRVVHTYIPQLRLAQHPYFKLVWAGSTRRGRANNLKWEGRLRLAGNSFVPGSLEKFHFYSRKNTVTETRAGLEWIGRTTGGVQGFIFALKNQAGTIDLTLNGKNFRFFVEKIFQKPHRHDMGGLDARFELYQVQPDDILDQHSFQYELPKMNKGDNPIFVKVVERNGEMAWSSPIYFVDKV